MEHSSVVSLPVSCLNQCDFGSHISFNPLVRFAFGVGILFCRTWTYLTEVSGLGVFYVVWFVH